MTAGGADGQDHRWRRRLAHADYWLCLRPEQAGRRRLGPYLQGVPAGVRLVQGEQARRDRLRLQRSRHVVLLRPLLGVHAGHRRGVRRRGRGRRPPQPARGAGKPRARRAHRPEPGHRRVRPVLLPGQAAGPRFLLPDVGAARTRGRQVADHDRAAPDRRAPVPHPDRRAVLQAGQGAAPRDRELPRGHQGGHRVHRRALAPGARRAGRVQQPGVGPGVPRPDHRRPRLAHRDDPRGVRDARRVRGRRGHHVAGHARRTLGQRRAGTQFLLPAVDDRHRHARAQRQGRPDPRVGPRAAPRADGGAAEGRRQAGRHLPLRHRRQRQGLPDQQVPARAGRPRSPRPVPARPRDLVQGGGPHRGGAGPHPPPGLAGHDPLRRHLLHARETGGGDRRIEPAHLRRDAR